MVFFPDDFPWKNKSLKEMLGTKFLKVSPRGSKLLKGYILVRFLSCFILSCKAAVRYAGLFF